MRCEQQISYNRLEAVEVLPESPELEKAVLGALILEPDQLGRCCRDRRNFGIPDPDTRQNLRHDALDARGRRQNRPLHAYAAL